MSDPDLDASTTTLFAGQLDCANPSITRGSVALGALLDLGYGGASADEAEQKERAEAIADALSIASELPFIPEIKSKWLQLGVDQAKDKALEGITDSVPSGAEKTYEDLQDSMRQSLSRSVADQLLQNDYLGSVEVTGSLRGGFEVAPHPVDGISLPTDPSAYVISDEGTVLGFNQESDAFTTWLGNSSLYSYLNTSVATPYLNEMGFGR